MSDPLKIHYANYAGRWVKTCGPLSIPRNPQGSPVIMRAGGLDRGREFASRWAEAVFTIQRGEAEMREFCRYESLYQFYKTQLSDRRCSRHK